MDANDLARIGQFPTNPAEGAELVLTGEACHRPDPAVENRLDADRRWVRGERGPPLALPLNVERILLFDPRQRGRFQYDEFSHATLIDGRRVADVDEMEIATWIYRVYRLKISDDIVSKVIKMIAARFPIHPVREYLSALQWDGVPRVRDLIGKYFEVSDPDPVYQRISEAWLVGSIARILSPGCKLDTVCILAGKQGIGKSRGLRAMMADPRWFSDSAINLDSKDALLQIHSGVWWWEFSELADLGKKEAERVKSFISSQVDRFRLPYSRNVQEWRRQVVFSGSTNRAGFLSDKSGSRRFWPVLVQRVHVDQIEADRDHLWAEALTIHASGVDWHLDRASQRALNAVSARFAETDSWEEAIRAWVDGLPPQERFTGGRVFREVLEIPLERRHRGQEMRVSAILSAIGLERSRRRVVGVDGRRGVEWAKPPGWEA